MAGNQLHPSNKRNAKGLSATKDSEKEAKFQRDTHDMKGQGWHSGEMEDTEESAKFNS